MDFKSHIWNLTSAFDDPASGKAPLSVIENIEDLSKIEMPRKNRDILLIVDIYGSVTVDVDLQSRIMSPQSLMVLLPGHTITSYNTSSDFKGFMISASIHNLTSALPLLSRLLICAMHFRDNPVVNLSESELVNQVLFRDLLRRKISNSSGIYDSLVINKLCEGIFYETLNLYFTKVDLRKTPQSRRSEALFYNFIVAIEDNFLTERSVAFYADRLCVTSKHLSSVVKEISGRTAGDWIDSYVINEIKNLLATTDLTIQEISCRLKFANQSFLGKYFKNHTGVSPREFRNRTVDLPV